MGWETLYFGSYTSSNGRGREREGASHRVGAFPHFGGGDRKLHGNARSPARLPAETDVEIDGGWNGKGESEEGKGIRACMHKQGYTVHYVCSAVVVWGREGSRVPCSKARE